MSQQVVIRISSGERDTCNDGEGESSLLVTSLEEEFRNLPPSLSSECCIFRTPERLQGQNVRAYTPHLVSIGPFHHGKKVYVDMEMDKVRYLHKFLVWTGMSLKTAVNFIKDRETRIRNSYEEIIKISSDELVRLVLLDAVFVFTFMCGGPEGLRIENDRLFGYSSRKEETMLDMLMLENQLPFFIFVELFELILRKGVLTEVTDQSKSIYRHCYETFKVCIKSSSVPIDVDQRSDIKHIIDLLRRCLLPSEGLKTCGKYDYALVVPTATSLFQAGVKFMVSLNGENMLDVRFSKGVLKIPCIYVDFKTEILFRNLLAFEQCGCEDRYITEYIWFMGFLIQTPEDVELLMQHKIMVNSLGNNEAASNLFNNLKLGLTSKSDNFYYGNLFKDLIKYRNYHRSWVTTLKHDYFKSPWTIMSILAAVTLLSLTFIQTVYVISFRYR